MLGTRLPFPRWLKHTVQIVVLGGVLALIWWSINWRESLDLLGSADLRWLFAAAIALTVQTVLSALRWRLTSARLGIEISASEAVKEYYLSQLVNQSLPGGVVGDAGRAVRSRAQAGLLRAGQAVVFERVAGQVGLLVLLTTGLMVASLSPEGLGWPAWLVWPVVLSLGAFACLVVVAAIAWHRSANSNAPMARLLRNFVRAVVARDVIGAQAVLSLATAICNVAAFALCAKGLGVGMAFLATATLVPLILFAMVIPLSISGWGIREGAAVLLFPIVGATASEGLAVSVAFGLVFLATVVPGLVISWLRPNARGFGRRGPTFDESHRGIRARSASKNTL